MEHKIKQRLAGAVVLVSLAVIFIPLILEGPDDEWSPPLQTMPQPPAMEYRAIPDLSLPEQEDVQETLIEDGGEAVQEETTREVVVESRSEPEPVPPPVTQQAAASQPEPSAAAPKAGWYVQAGSFGNRENAARRRDLLAGKGFEVQLQENPSAGGSTWRVLVGPSASREAGVRVQEKLRTTHEIGGIVIQLGG